MRKYERSDGSCNKSKLTWVSGLVQELTKLRLITDEVAPDLLSH